MRVLHLPHTARIFEVPSVLEKKVGGYIPSSPELDLPILNHHTQKLGPMMHGQRICA